MKQNDKVKISGHEAVCKVYRDWGYVRRVAKDGTWADVILGRYCCIRIPTSDLKIMDD